MGRPRRSKQTSRFKLVLVKPDDYGYDGPAPAWNDVLVHHNGLHRLCALLGYVPPGRQTIALCGDGGFTMLQLGDLPTLVQRKSRVVHIILNNESLGFVKIEQQEAGIVPYGVDFKNPNFARVAEAMGAKGIRLEAPGDVREALTEALAHKDGPVVVDAVVDPYALSLPSHVPFHTAKGYTLSLAKQAAAGRFDDVIKTMERNVRLV
ncbi:MAG: thiamine pyrophosphate-dependent enzyme [Candidatus Acidiferrales bacterium]